MVEITRSRIITSSGLALALFVVLNCIALSLFLQSKGNSNEDLAAGIVASRPAHSDVAFVGSSMVLYPLVYLDKEEGVKIPAINQYTEVHCVENAISRILHRPIHADNVAYLGFMLSDDYFILDNYLTGKHTPSTVVMLLAPRDFYDTTFKSAAEGIAFRKLADWSRTAEFCGKYLLEPADYIDFGVSHCFFCFLFGTNCRTKFMT